MTAVEATPDRAGGNGAPVPGRPAVLLVEAHPDDLELGMGGTAALLARSFALHVVCLTRSERSLPGREPAEVAALRTEEGRAAAAILGAAIELHDLPDAGLLDERDRVTTIVGNAIARIHPAFVCTHWPDDYHVDHAVCARAVAGRAPSLVLWEGDSSLGFRPNAHVDVTPVIGTKRRLLDAFPSQHYMGSFPRAFELLARRGKAIGSWFAEAFSVPDPATRAAFVAALGERARMLEG